MNKKLDELAKDARCRRSRSKPPGSSSSKTRPATWERSSRSLPRKSASQPDTPGEKAKDAAGSAQQSGDKMQAAREAGRKGQRDQAGEARDRRRAIDGAGRPAGGEAAKQMDGGDKGAGSPRAGKAMEKAKDQMGEAGKRLGQGQPGEAGEAMEKAARVAAAGGRISSARAAGRRPAEAGPGNRRQELRAATSAGPAARSTWRLRRRTWRITQARPGANCRARSRTRSSSEMKARMARTMLGISSCTSSNWPSGNSEMPTQVNWIRSGETSTIA